VAHAVLDPTVRVTSRRTLADVPRTIHREIAVASSASGKPSKRCARPLCSAQLSANHSDSLRVASLRAKCGSLLCSAPRACACRPLFLSRTAQLVLVFQASSQQNTQHRREVRFSTNSTPPPRHTSLVGLPCARGSDWLGLSCSESLDARTKQWSVRETCNVQHGQNAT
jgi:hypothetical protein